MDLLEAYSSDDDSTHPPSGAPSLKTSPISQLLKPFDGGGYAPCLVFLEVKSELLRERHASHALCKPARAADGSAKHGSGSQSMEAYTQLCSQTLFPQFSWQPLPSREDKAVKLPLHLSLSKTGLLKMGRLDELFRFAEDAFGDLPACELAVSGYMLLPNPATRRLFFAAAVEDVQAGEGEGGTTAAVEGAPSDGASAAGAAAAADSQALASPLQLLLDRADALMRIFKQETFYRPPLFHISVCYTEGWREGEALVTAQGRPVGSSATTVSVGTVDRSSAAALELADKKDAEEGLLSGSKRGRAEEEEEGQDTGDRKKAAGGEGGTMAVVKHHSSILSQRPSSSSSPPLPLGAAPPSPSSRPIDASVASSSSAAPLQTRLQSPELPELILSVPAVWVAAGNRFHRVGLKKS